MVELVTSIIVLVAGIGLCQYVGRRRPVGTPVTWGEAFVGATFVFGLMLVAYGIVPNQWMKYADNTLKWRADRTGIPGGPFFGGHALLKHGITFFGRGKITITYQAVRDIIASGIYIVMLGLHVALWVSWQKRGQKQQAGDVEVVSAFGRPVVRRV